MNEQYKYFNDGLESNSLYTIINFQKGVNSDLDKHISVLMAFNHLTLQIERFLINYGEVYDVKTESSKNLYTIKDFKHDFVKTDNKLKKNFIKNNVRDVKFTRKFLTIFLLLLINNKKIHREPEYQFKDMRVIAYLQQNRKDMDIYKVNTHQKSILYTDRRYINIPERFSSLAIQKMISEAYPNIRVNTYKTSELPEYLKILKRNINGKVFKDNVDLEERISRYNTITIKQYKKFD